LIVLIDGYNLLRHAFSKEKGKLIKQREQFIRQLGYYKSKKENLQIIVVFDGGLSRHATREVHAGVVVIYSGQNSSADNWILDFVQKNKEKELLVVTLDRELKDKCSNFGADNISVKDFYNLVQNAILEDIEILDKKSKNHTYKLEKNENFEDLFKGFDEKNSKALDLLMTQDLGNFEMFKIDADSTYKTNKTNRKSKSEFLSKQDKKLQKKIKKL